MRVVSFKTAAVLIVVAVATPHARAHESRPLYIEVPAFGGYWSTPAGHAPQEQVIRIGRSTLSG